MSSVDVNENIIRMDFFRQNMGRFLPKEKVKNFWGAQFISLVDGEDKLENEQVIKEKIRIVKKNIHKFLILDWVRFIGITGSVASGTAKMEDDIDIFIVVKNDCMWLYRGLITLRLGFNSVRRVWGKSFDNKVDTNFICEERGLSFSSKSIFVLHELLFMIPVYNKKYYGHILGVNHKLMNNFAIDMQQKEGEKTRSYVYRIFNTFAFLLQYVYMLVMRHKPDYNRLIKNNRVGRIEFFPKDFQENKLREFNKLLRTSRVA